MNKMLGNISFSLAIVCFQ